MMARASPDTLADVLGLARRWGMNPPNANHPWQDNEQPRAPSPAFPLMPALLTPCTEGGDPDPTLPSSVVEASRSGGAYPAARPEPPGMRRAPQNSICIPVGPILNLDVQGPTSSQDPVLPPGGFTLRDLALAWAAT